MNTRVLPFATLPEQTRCRLYEHAFFEMGCAVSDEAWACDLVFFLRYISSRSRSSDCVVGMNGVSRNVKQRVRKGHVPAHLFYAAET